MNVASSPHSGMQILSTALIVCRQHGSGSFEAEKQLTMPEQAYVFALDAAGLNYGRVRFMTVGGEVIMLVVQQETMVGGKGVPVVRYDNHHGFCHRDRMHRRGDVVEKIVNGVRQETWQRLA